MSELLKINVNEHLEKKNGLSYLSWAWAWAEVLKIDADADWQAHEWNGQPAMFLPDGSAMVKTTVTIKGKHKTCSLPVMDHRNKAIKNPDAFAINTATMRCMTKAISMHGLGLYIYAGEDMPEDDTGTPEPPSVKRKEAERTTIMKVVHAIQDKLSRGLELGALQEYDGAWDRGEDFVTSVWNSLTTPQREEITRLQNERESKKDAQNASVTA